MKYQKTRYIGMSRVVLSRREEGELEKSLMDGLRKIKPILDQLERWRRDSLNCNYRF